MDNDQGELFGRLVFDVKLGMFNTCFFVGGGVIHTYPRLMSKPQGFGGTPLSLKSIMDAGKDKITQSSTVVGRVYAWREDGGVVSDVRCSTGFYVSPTLIATSRHATESFPSGVHPNQYSFLAADFCPFSEQAGYIGTPIQPIQEADDAHKDLDFKCFTIGTPSDKYFRPSDVIITAQSTELQRVCYSLQYNGDVEESVMKSHYKSPQLATLVPIPPSDPAIASTLSPNTRTVGIGRCSLRTDEMGLLVEISLNYGASGGPVCLLSDDAFRFVAVVLGRNETTNSNRAEPVVFDPLFQSYYDKYIKATL